MEVLKFLGSVKVIYFVSDLHGDRHFKGFEQYLSMAKDDDLLIILGDVGLNFEKTKENEEFTEYFLSVKKNIAFIDGNHENFEYLNSFPEEDWNGGKVRRLTENIVMLKRGNVYTINGKTFFSFGGCKSSPIWKERGLWFYGEEPEKEELDLAYYSLEKNNYCIDYILTHKYEHPEGNIMVCVGLQELTKFIEENVTYQQWYSGHQHTEIRADEKHYLVFDNLVELE